MKSSEVQFSPGFNVITGETGAGKSVLLSALLLLLGARVETDAIRHGEEMAMIEGEFELCQTDDLLPLFDEYGLDLADMSAIKKEQEEVKEKNQGFNQDRYILLIGRQLYRNGKHKSFINGQLVPAQLIRSVAPLILHHYDQETCFQLKSIDAALHHLDQYAGLGDMKNSFEKQYRLYQELQLQYDTLQKEEQFKEIELEQLARDIKAIESLDLSTLDEEELFQSYQNSKSHQKTREQICKLCDMLDREGAGLLARTKQAHQIAQGLSHSTLTDLLQTALTHLQESSYVLEKELDQPHLSEAELQQIEKRLSLFDSLKRKYIATSQEELLDVLQKKQKRKESLLQREEEIKELLTTLEQAKIQLDNLATILSQKRSEHISSLHQEVEKRLALMQMKEATFRAHLTKKARSHTGDDQCVFFFKPNMGEKEVAIHEGASHGELARIFLALSAMLASKSHKSTLLFDEIDANIGGITARSVGQLIKEIALERQVLVITHFPQVAESADCHFVLNKDVVDTRTITSITKITNQKSLKKEHQRMAGKE